MKALAGRHVGIVVSDMQSALRFYQGYLGLEESLEVRRHGEYISQLAGIEDVDVEIRILTVADGFKVELLQFHSHPALAGQPAVLCDIGRSHVALTVDDLMGLYQKRDTYGVRFNTAPIHSPDGVLVCFCHDPDGTLVELVQPL